MFVCYEFTPDVEWKNAWNEVFLDMNSVAATTPAGFAANARNADEDGFRWQG